MSSNHHSKDFKPIPVYTTPGDWEAVLVFPYLYNTVGEWIGWVTPKREVYDVDGVYVGWLTDEPRVLRRRIYDKPLPRRTPPPPPNSVRPPATVPLPPMMAELPFEIIDVLEEEPRLLHTSDSGELKEDLN
ncbi:MAG: hypothetical protein WBR18_05490 [Anaerolineales bacterium]